MHLVHIGVIFVPIFTQEERVMKKNEIVIFTDENTSVEIFDRSEEKALRPPMYYNLDVIISVGYRVKSKRGVAFATLLMI